MKITNKAQANLIRRTHSTITLAILGILLLTFAVTGAQAAEFSLFESVKNLLSRQASQNRTPLAAHSQGQESNELSSSARPSVTMDAPAFFWSNADNSAWLITEEPFLKVVVAPPTLGNYANTTIALAGNTIITPSAAPTNAASATATTIAAFKGKLEVDPATGVVRVTNAHPANLTGQTYPVTVTAYAADGTTTTKTFNLAVTTPAGCNAFVPLSFGANNISFGGSQSVAVGDFNGDGKQDIVTANNNSSVASVLLRNSANNGFDPKVDYTVGSNPRSVAVADFNGDGKQDVVTANYTNHNVSVLLRNAANTGFDAAVNFVTGTNPISVAVGDFNADGKQDIVAANFGTGVNAVSVLLRNAANNGFDAKVDYAVNNSPVSVAVADFNGDDKQDIVAVNNQSSGVASVLLRNAANTGFDPKVDFNVGFSPTSVAAGDFNGDGKQDFATASGNGDNVSVLLRNAANNGFDSKVDYGVDDNPVELTVGDFNNDGKQDIVTANSGSGSAFNNISVLLRNAANTGFDAKIDFNAGTSSVGAVAVGDFNGDNRQDITALNTGNVRIYVLQRVCNNPPGFTSVTNQIRAQGVTSNSQIAVVNDPETAAGGLTVTATTVPAGITVSNIVNTNGTITADVGAGISTPAGDYTVVLTVSDGGLSTNANLIVTVVFPTREIVVRGNNVIIADGDNTPSLADHTDFGPVALANTRERTFTIENIGATTLTIGTVTVTGGQAAAFTVTQQPAASLQLFGTTTFKVRFAPPALGLHSTTVSFGNNDSDENPFDFVIQATGITAPTLGDYANTTIPLSGNTTVTPNAAPSNNTSATATTSPDFKGKLEVDPTTGVVRITNAHSANGAGESYLVTVRAYNAGGATTKPFNLTVTTPTGCSTFNASAFASSSYPASISSANSPAVADFNGDGKQDIVTGSGSSFGNTISVLLRNASNTGFNAVVNLTVGTYPFSVGVGDFNGDGRPDIVAANNSSNNISVLMRNAANTGFDPKVDFAVGNGPLSVAVGDFNGDGRPDIATANSSSNNVSVLMRNAANDGFDAAVNYAVGNGAAGVAVGDFNGDGKQDIAATNNTSNTVSVLLRNSTNDGFDAPANYTVGTGPLAVAVGDFNGDGKHDIVVNNAGSGGNTVSVLLRNAANNGFDAAVNYPNNVYSFAVAVGDFNHDGKQDIATSNQTNGVAVLLRNAVNNGFDAKVDFSVPNSGNSVAVGDFNGDNRQDIVTTDTFSNVRVLQRVCNNAPSFTSVTNQTRLQGASSNSQIAIVSDPETAAGGLTVTATTVPAGITISNIVNTNGTITADVGAAVNTPAGDYTVVLSVFDGQLSTNANLIVTVTPIAQEVVVRGNNVIIADGDNSPSLADHTDFDSVAIGSTRERTFTIENIGVNPLTIQNVTISGGQSAAFSVTQQPASSVAANGSTTFKIRFAPTALGTQSTTISFGNNDADENPFDFAVQATGIAAPTLGNYANTTIPLSGNTTVTPSSAPTNATSATATTTADFKGELEVDSTTGVVRVTNVHPANRAGESYLITVTAYNAGGTTTKTFNLTVTTPPTCPLFDATTFAPVVNYATGFGSNPVAMAIGDFNADGKQDIVTNYSASGSISVLLRNAANDGFDSPVNLPAGFSPRSAAVGDFNADGKQDIVVATSGSGNTVVSVLLRNAANNGFDAKIDYPAGTNPQTVVVGDFNGDGKQDIAATNSNASGTISVLLRNAANNGFDAPVSFAVGSNPGAPAVGDFNGDGRPDIVVANYNSSDLSVLFRNAANNGFDPAFNITVGTNPGSVAAGDFNADGRQDIVFSGGSFGSSAVSVLLRNAANNGFDAAVGYVTGVNPFGAAVGDFNNDGKQDIVTANYSSAAVSVLLRNAANTGFNPKVDLAVGAGPFTVAVGDFNADGKQDIVTANQSSDNVSVLQRGNCPPFVVPTIGLTRQQGSPATNSQIAAVEDFETPAGNLSVQATTIPTGMTVGSIINSNGTVTANVGAICAATVGNNSIVLTATDAGNASTNANLIVNVTANTPPTLVYPNASVTSNGSTTVNPSTATDNVGISSYSLQSQGTYTGTISVNSATGAVSIGSAAPVGAHTITIRATDNCTATTDASFTLTVNQPPAITSANNTTFTVGAAGSFTFTATGSPTPAISRTGSLPGGVTFTDNGNGTASLTGTPSAGSGGTYPLTITASNGVSPNATQSFTLTVNQAPTFTNANNTTFTVGSAGSFNVTTSAFPQATSITFTGTLASGVTFTNNGNGTATIAGTPAAGTGGSYPLTITASNGISPNATQNFTLTVNQAPAASYEGDVNPRPAQVGNPVPGQSGDGVVTSGDVTQVRRFALGLDTPDAPPNASNEFQKADCAPLSTHGDGIIASGDVTQARRYALGLDSRQLTSSLTALSMLLTSAPDADDSVEAQTDGSFELAAPMNHPRTVYPSTVSRVGNTLTVGVYLNTFAGETLANSLSFTLNFNTAHLSSPTNIRLGSGGNSATLGTNENQVGSGILGILLDLPPGSPAPVAGRTFATGNQQLVLIDFTVAAGAPSTSNVFFTSTPTPRFIADVTANRLDDATTFTGTAAASPASISLTGPTAAEARIAGRVKNTAGAGIGEVEVTVLDTSSGGMQTVRTAEDGTYRFDGLAVGGDYVVEAKSAGYSFSPASRQISLTEDVAEEDFIATATKKRTRIAFR